MAVFFFPILIDERRNLNPETNGKTAQKAFNTLPPVSGDHIKIIDPCLHGDADYPFDQGQPQKGNKGLDVSSLPEPAALAGGNDQTLHSH